MALRFKNRIEVAQGLTTDGIIIFPAPIISSSAPLASDRAVLGTVWIDKTNDDAYFLTSIKANVATWINAGGGSGVFTNLTASGTVTFSALASTAAGMLQIGTTGILSVLEDGLDGEILIGTTAGAAAWSTLTAGAGMTITEAAGTITLAASTTGATFGTTVNGPVSPTVGGLTTFIGYDANITTDGVLANNVKIRLADDVSVVGALTAGANLNMTTGTCVITSDTNIGQDIYLHADGGTSETIELYADQGTNPASVYLHSDLGGLTFVSGLASADAININASNAAGGIDVDFGTGGLSVVGANGAINLESGTAAINVGVDGVAHTVTVGTTTGVGATVIQSGTGDVNITSTDKINLDAVGTVELNSSTSTISIGNDAVSQNMNFGTAGERVISIGNTTGVTQLVLDSGTGGIQLASTGAGDISINSDDTLLLDSDGVLELNSSAGIISIGNDAIAQDMNFGTGAAARIITIGNGTLATSVVVNSGTGNLDLGVNATDHTTRMGSTNGTSATTLQSGTGAMTFTAGGIYDVNAAGAITIDSSAGTIGIGVDDIDQTISIGTAGERVITVGNIVGVCGLNFNAGTGGIDFVSTGASPITFTGGSTFLVDCAGVLELNSSAGIIGIGNDAVSQAINIGIAGVRVVTVGSATGASQTVLDCGTAGINVGTTANEHTTTVGSTNGASALTLQTGTGALTYTCGGAVAIDATTTLELNAGGIIGIGNDADAADINIGTGAAARVITMGNIIGATGLNFNAGTGGIDFVSTGASPITFVGGSTILLDCAGVLELNSSAGIISIGNDDIDQNINIGTDGVRVVTIGSANTTASTAINCGTSGINVGTSANEHTSTFGSTNAGSITTVQAGTGALTMTAGGAFDVNAAGAITIDSSAGTIGIGIDDIDQAINIGTVGERVITVGNIVGAAGLNFNAGTGGIDFVSTGASPITFAGGSTILMDCAGVLELNSSAGVIGIGNDAVSQNINIGTGAAARVITIGNATLASQVVIDCGTAGVSIGASATEHTSTFGSTNAGSATTVQSGTGSMTFTAGGTFDVNATGLLTLDSSGGLINIGNNAVAQNMNIGTGAAARIITIGNITDATGLNFNAGTGGIDFVSTGASPITFGSGSTFVVDAVGAIELESSAAAISIGTDDIDQVINIGTNGERVVTVGSENGAATTDIQTGTGALTLGTGATDHTTTMGSTTVVSATTIQSGTGAMTFTAGGAFDVNATGAVTIDSSGGTIGIGIDDIDQAINVGTVGERVITVGNIVGATGLNFNAGTGGIDFVSTGASPITFAGGSTILVDCAGVLELNSSAGVIGIGNDAVAADINIGTGAAARIVTIGNISDTSQVVLNSGTGGIQLASTGGGDITLDSDDTLLLDSDGVLELNSSLGAISIGNDNVNQAINIGTNGDRTITVGSDAALLSYVCAHQNVATGASTLLTERDASGGAIVVTATQLIGGYSYIGAAGGGVTLTMPAAADVQAELLTHNITSAAGLRLTPIWISVSDAQNLTVTAGAGGTVIGTAAVNASTAQVLPIFSAAATIDFLVIQG